MERAEELPYERDVFIALGGNVGDVLRTFRVALLELDRRGVKVNRVSAAYRTRAMVLPGSKTQQPDYWNAVCHARTSLHPRQLLALFHELEQEAGRRREVVWGDRTLDVDLLTYGDMTLQSPDLHVPHPRIPERTFVLRPWMELAADMPLPGFGATVRELLGRFADPDAGIEYRLRGWVTPPRGSVGCRG